MPLVLSSRESAPLSRWLVFHIIFPPARLLVGPVTRVSWLAWAKRILMLGE